MSAVVADRGERIASGMLSDVFRVRVEGRSWVEKRRKANFGAYGQNRAAETIVRELLGRPRSFSLLEMARVDGRDLFEYVMSATADPLTPQVAARIPHMLAEIHSLSADGFGELGVPGEPSAHAFFHALLTKECEGAWVRREGLEARYRDWILARLDSFCSRLAGPCLVHGDFHPGNLLPAPDGRLFLIDWESSRFRSPHFDFVQLRFFSDIRGDEVFAQAASAYCGLRHLPLADFLEDVRWLCAYWAARLLNFLEVHGHQAHFAPELPADLARWIARLLGAQDAPQRQGAGLAARRPPFAQDDQKPECVEMNASNLPTSRLPKPEA